MFLGKLDLNKERSPTWEWLKSYLTPTRYHDSSRPYSQYPPSLHMLVDNGIKAISCGILGGKLLIKCLNTSNQGRFY